MEISNGYAVESSSRPAEPVADSASLLTAAWVGHSTGVRLLLAAHADPLATDADGRAALWLASRAGHHDVVRLLLEARADMEAVWFHSLAEMDMSDQADPDEVEMEPEHAWGVAGSGRGLTALAAASAKGRIQVVKILLEAGANQDAQGHDSGGIPPLVASARCGQTQVVRTLLQARALVNSVSPVDGGSALGWAASEGRHLVAELLLEAGAAVDARDDDDASPLLWAASEGHLKVLQLLLAARASPGLADIQGCRPLELARAGGHEEVVQLLEEVESTHDRCSNEQALACS